MWTRRARLSWVISVLLSAVIIVCPSRRTLVMKNLLCSPRTHYIRRFVEQINEHTSLVGNSGADVHRRKGKHLSGGSAAL